MASTSNDNISKKDLDLILEVNRKTIEIQMAVTDQNEEVLDLLNESKKIEDQIDSKSNQIDKKIDDIGKNLSQFDLAINQINNKLDQINNRLDKIKEGSENISKDLFKVQVLFASGLISLVIQVIQMFKK